MRTARVATAVLDAALWACGAALHGLHRLLGLRAIGRIGLLAGDALFLADRPRRAVLEEELSRLLADSRSPAEVRATARRSCEQFCARLFETAFFGSLDRRRLERLARATGLANVDAALARGRGVILLLSHSGSFLLPLPFLGFRGYTVNQVTGTQVHAGLLAERIWLWRKRQADRLPVRFLQVDRFLRPLYDALRRNEVVAIAFDGRESTRWADVAFFGRRARFSTGPFDLARRTGAAIVPTFVVRERDGRHRIEFAEPFRLSGAADPEDAVRQEVAGFAKLFERHVAEHPCHFGMVLYNYRRETTDPRNALFPDAGVTTQPPSGEAPCTSR